jgi:flagellar biosynthesis activator protein FlaF
MEKPAIMSVSAYKRTIRDTESPRDIERRVLSRINAKLQELAQNFDPADPATRIVSSELREAVWENQRFWMTIKADLATPQNELGTEIRATLISLAMWIDKQSGKVLANEGNLQPMVDVNNNIIAGLSGQRNG